MMTDKPKPQSPPCGLPPFHLLVGEPELKWCEALLNGFMAVWIENLTCGERWQGRFTIAQSHPESQKQILMANTNLSETRVDRALEILRRQGRI